MTGKEDMIGQIHRRFESHGAVASLVILLLSASRPGQCAAQAIAPVTTPPTANNRVADAPVVAAQVQPIQAIKLIASLPGGQPAVGALAVIRSTTSRRSPGRVRNQPDTVSTDEAGHADLVRHDAWQKNAVVEVTLVTSDQGFEARVPLSSAVDDVLNVVLSPAWVIEGRVLVDGEPVGGAVVSIRQLIRRQRTIGGRTVSFFTASGVKEVVSGEDGRYRAAVAPGQSYSVSAESLPGESARLGTSYNPEQVGEGRLRVRDFAFVRGDQEIAGRVLDIDGNPIPRASVEVVRQGDVNPGLWLGYDSRSRYTTDSQGSFRIKGVPAGKYQLRIRRSRKSSNRQIDTKVVDAETGKKDIEVTMDAGSLLDILR